MSIVELSDELLLKNIHQYDDHISFTILFRRHWKSLHKIVLSKTGDATVAEDLVQEIFVHLWENRHKLNAVISINGYLYGIARNKIFDYYRTSRKYGEAIALLDRYLKSEAPPSTENLDEREIREKLFDKAVEDLPERTRKIYILRARDQYSYEEIAKALDIKPQTARNAYSRAISILHQSTDGLLIMVLLFYII